MFVIATSGRSGSTVLARTLAINGVPEALELLNWDRDENFKRFKELRSSYLPWFNRQPATKLFRDDLTVRLRVDLKQQWFPWLSERVTRCIWLRRKDRVAQAVSAHFSARCQVYESVSQREYERREVAYSTVSPDLVGIRYELERLDGEEEFWKDTLKGASFPVLPLYYEDFIAMPGPVTRTCLLFLGKHVGKPQLLPLRSKPSPVVTRWAERFKNSIFAPK